jgi:hypothetical protein
MFNTIKLRFFLFLFGCIGSRLIFTALAAFSKGLILKLLGVLALVPIIGWFYIIFIGKRDTGLEVFGEKIWWKNLRPIHMFLWATFSYLAITGSSRAWLALLGDTLFGLLSFLIYHCAFSKSAQNLIFSN